MKKTLICLNCLFLIFCISLNTAVFAKGKTDSNVLQVEDTGSAGLQGIDLGLLKANKEVTDAVSQYNKTKESIEYRDSSLDDETLDKTY